MVQGELSALAPAKVNLSLRITGKRADGYHLLDSVTVFTDFGDRITVAPSDQRTLTVEGPFAAGIPTDEGNLVLKAANALCRETGQDLGARITLTKSLPAAGGIGGGSSDAAVTMHMLNCLWGLGLSAQDLARIGVALGADMPVCLHGRPCRMQGIGEDLTDLPPLPPIGILLANPGEACETPAVFKARTGPFSPGFPDFAPGQSAQDLAEALADHPNDLTPAAQSVCPAIGPLLATLDTLPGRLIARMSGSGATCFALFETVAAAQEAQRSINQPGWWVQAGGLLR